MTLTFDVEMLAPHVAYAHAPIGSFGECFRQNVAVAKIALEESAVSEKDRQHAKLIEQHIIYAKYRIIDKLLKLRKDTLTSGTAVLSFGSTAPHKVTDDCVLSGIISRPVSVVFNVPNHFAYAETRAAVCSWLLAEGFTEAVFTPDAQSTTMQGQLMLKWAV